MKVSDAVLGLYKDGLDFGDSFHLVNSQQADAFLTFDKKFVKQADGKSAVSVQFPTT